MHALINRLVLLFIIVFFIQCENSKLHIYKKEILSGLYSFSYKSKCNYQVEYFNFDNIYISYLFLVDKKNKIRIKFTILSNDSRIDKDDLYLHEIYSNGKNKIVEYFQNRINMDYISCSKSDDISTISFLQDNQLYIIDNKLNFNPLICRVLITVNKKNGNINDLHKVSSQLVKSIKIKKN